MLELGLEIAIPTVEVRNVHGSVLGYQIYKFYITREDIFAKVFICTSEWSGQVTKFTFLLIEAAIFKSIKGKCPLMCMQ
jgi:hypothetical protein